MTARCSVVGEALFKALGRVESLEWFTVETEMNGNTIVRFRCHGADDEIEVPAKSIHEAANEAVAIETIVGTIKTKIASGDR